MARNGNGGSAYHKHNRPHTPASHKVAAALPTPDPEFKEAMECVKDGRYNKGGLETGGIKTTANPKDTP